MNDIQTITRHGFSIKGENDLDLAFLSLRIALKAYFSTYNVIRNSFDPDDSDLDKTLQDNLRYYEACAEAIVHFQHFFELIIKDILRRDHLLLASRILSHPSILHKVLHNQPLSAEEGQRVQSVEFGDALTTLCDLIKSKQIQCHQDMKFIMDHKRTLEELNILRNRVWHRGAFFLFYTKLDEFVGKYMLPLIDITTQLAQYTHLRALWKYKHTECGIDPIESLCLEYKKKEPVRVGKIALLKEIGRAAYNNPLFDKKVLAKQNDERMADIEEQIRQIGERGEDIPKRLLISKGMIGLASRTAMKIDAPYIERAKTIAKAQAEEKYYRISECPICGVESLILYDDRDSFEDSETGSNVVYDFVYSAKCECCTFEIDSKLKIEDYDIPVENYWTVKRF